MCSFIILLLLLCKNGGNCGCNDGFNAGNYARRNEYRRIDRDRDCGCSACEDVASEESPIVEREDIWTSYKNTSSGKPCK